MRSKNIKVSRQTAKIVRLLKAYGQFYERVATGVANSGLCSDWQSDFEPHLERIESKLYDLLNLSIKDKNAAVTAKFQII